MFTKFQRLVYEKTREIPAGKVSTYQEIARAIGKPKAFRAVGNALNKNPTPIDVPCHRVVRSDFRIGGFSKGPSTKMRLLKLEGISICDGKILGDIHRLGPC
jgi:methylated-DNA-[protein]-cysteine S-methyltransferase